MTTEVLNTANGLQTTITAVNSILADFVLPVEDTITTGDLGALFIKVQVKIAAAVNPDGTENTAIPGALNSKAHDAYIAFKNALNELLSETQDSLDAL